MSAADPVPTITDLRMSLSGGHITIRPDHDHPTSGDYIGTALEVETGWWVSSRADIPLTANPGDFTWFVAETLQGAAQQLLEAHLDGWQTEYDQAMGSEG